MLVCFSLTKNIPSLLSMKAGRRSNLCLNGIRFLAMCWVLLGHTFAYITAPGSFANQMIRESFGILIHTFKRPLPIKRPSLSIAKMFAKNLLNTNLKTPPPTLLPKGLLLLYILTCSLKMIKWSHYQMPTTWA